MKIELAFLGATGTVTGSKYYLRAGAKAVLVDCGLFQGLKALRLRNWAAPAVARGGRCCRAHARAYRSQRYLTRFVRDMNACASSRPIQNICVLRLALPPSRVQELQDLEDNEHNNAGTKRQREIVHVQRSEAEEIARKRPKQRQAQHRRDGKEDQMRAPDLAGGEP